MLLAFVVLFGFVWYAFQSPEPQSAKPAASPATPVLEQAESTPSLSTPELEPETAPAPQSHGPNAISGAVTDHTSAPVARAEIAAYDPNLGAKKTTSDSNGRFSIGGLDTSRTYRVSANAPHFNEAAAENVSPGTDDVVLALEPMSAARGIVVDASTGAPVTAFEVAFVFPPPENAADWNARSLGSSVAWSPVSDASGAFEINDVLSDQPFAVAARAKGHSSAFAPCDAVAPGESIDGIVIRLARGATIAGIVETDRGVPVADAAIVIGTTGVSLEDAARSDADGAFTIDDLPAATLVVSAVHPEYGFARADVTAAAGIESRVRLVMATGGAIEGVVTNNGAPAANARIHINTQPGSNQDPSFRSEEYRQTTTDADGRFMVSGLGGGAYDVMAILPSDDGGSASEVRLTAAAEVETGKITSVTIAFAPAFASVSVNVTMNGEPVIDGEVRGVIGTGSGDKRFGGPLNDQGAYRAERLPAGVAYVEIIANQPTGVLKRAITFPLRDGEDAEHDVALDAQTAIAGRVTSLAEGEHAEVIVVAGQPDADAGSVQELLALRHSAAGHAEVAEDGAFRVEGIEPGAYTIIAVAFTPDDDAGDPIDSMRLTKTPVTVADGVTTELDLAP
ncbi:MAG: carboxypeptidase regulatory-like domain-containing protein [Candidatus Hydrogenedentes bacterium]|nr:carboxypeptidase regulatory-like domain-containing protein [Candidatus Hydrogenedentota bacterium]